MQNTPTKNPFDMSLDELRANLAVLEAEIAKRGDTEHTELQTTPEEAIEAVAAYHQLMTAVRSEDPDIALEAAKTVLDKAGYLPWSRFGPLDLSDPAFALHCVRAELTARGEPVD